MSAGNLWELVLEGAERGGGAKGAVLSTGAELDYLGLTKGARGIAGALRESGIGRGDRVGVWMDKTPQCVQTILGILAAGAAYVPLDPRAPWRRCRAIAEDCGFQAFAADEPRLAAVPEVLRGLDVRLLLAGGAEAAAGAAGRDADAPAAPLVLPLAEAAAFPARPLPSPGPEDVAYILYTSGSTGVPKGVVHTHGSGLAFTRWVIRRFDVRADDVFSSHAPFHFDLSISDLYASLGSGGTVRLISSLEGMLAPWLARQIDDWGITVWYSVPSILVSMLETGLLTAPAWPRLRLLLFAGEVFPTPQLRRLRRAVPGAGLYNLFGPTETNVCTYYEVPAEIPDGQTEPIPIGRTCEHLETFVLDDAGSVAAPGAEGTLWARGANLMLGYWNDPQRTAATLQADPRGGPGLAYCTGDRVVQQEDGEYRFRGRRDHQVKIRGYRIELGDVEAALAAHADVLEAVALPLEREGTAARLVATVVARAGSEPSPDELRDHSRRHLPAYMVPERIEVAPALPRTSSGKADRTALRSAWESKGDAWI